MTDTDDNDQMFDATGGGALDRLMGMARAHGELADTHNRIDDLEDMLRVAWSMLTDAQRDEFRSHPDILAIAEAAGVSWNE